MDSDEVRLANGYSFCPQSNGNIMVSVGDDDGDYASMSLPRSVCRAIAEYLEVADSQFWKE